MRTQFAKKGDVEQKWYLVDAKDAILGRLAVRIANRLRGKDKPQFTPHTDTGDFIIVINADKVKLTGKKLDNKVYYSHSGYPGGIKAETARERLTKKPEKVIFSAVWGMLPHNKVGRHLMSRLKVYGGNDHPHTAQNPTPVK